MQKLTQTNAGILQDSFSANRNKKSKAPLKTNSVPKTRVVEDDKENYVDFGSDEEHPVKKRKFIGLPQSRPKKVTLTTKPAKKSSNPVVIPQIDAVSSHHSSHEVLPEIEQTTNDMLTTRKRRFKERDSDTKTQVPFNFDDSADGAGVAEEVDAPRPEKIFLVPGRAHRDAAPRSSPDSYEVTVVTRPITGPARFTDEVVTLSENGDLKVDGVFIIKYDKQTMDLIKKLNLDLSKLKVLNSGRRSTYLYIGGERLNCILGAALKQEHSEDLKRRGFTGDIEDLDHVSHNDGNSLNNILSNLLNGPTQRGPTSWNTSIVLAGSNPIYSVTVSNPDEALVQYDILKVKHCLEHVKQSPVLAQEIIFEHGLLRPRNYVDLGYYASIDTLLSHSDDWVKDISKRRGKGKVVRERFRLLDVEGDDANQAIKDSLNIPGNLPFDSSIHVIFEYIGLRNLHQRIVNKDFYESTVKTFEGNVLENKGYMEFAKLGKLHNLALGRKVGDHQNDKLQGCHGVGGLLDNRVTKKADGSLDPKTLTLGSASTYASHIFRKKVGSTSRYPGVKISKSKKFVGQWRLESNDYYLGTYSQEITAANSYAHVQENREEIAGQVIRDTSLVVAEEAEGDDEEEEELDIEESIVL